MLARAPALVDSGKLDAREGELRDGPDGRGGEARFDDAEEVVEDEEGEAGVDPGDHAGFVQPHLCSE